jgi:hypothetical protein
MALVPTSERKRGSDLGVPIWRKPIARAAHVTRRAVRDVFPAWLVLSLVTSLPYVIAQFKTPPGTTFTGVLSAHDDTFSYLAWIKQGADGHVLMREMYTSEPQTSRFFLPLWLGLGWMSKITALSAAAVFHIARVIMALALLLAVWGVGRLIVMSRTRLRFLIWIAGFSAGLGWVSFALGDLGGILSGKTTVHSYEIGAVPVDLNMPEATVFRSAFAQVHTTLGAAMICATMVLVIKALLKQRARYAVAAGMIGSCLAVVHPYQVIVTSLVAGALFLCSPWIAPISRERVSRMPARSVTQTDSLRCLMAFYLGNLPGFCYLLYIRSADPVAREWIQKMSTPSPAPIQYLIGFGFTGALAVLGGWVVWKRKNLGSRLIVVWAVVQSFLLYLPVSFQRRFIEGLQIPLAVLASVGIFWLLDQSGFPRRGRRALLAVVVVIMSISNLGFIVGEAAGFSQPDPRRYLDADVATALKWLGPDAKPGSVLLSSYMTGNIAPSISGVAVFLGHYDQTLNSDRKTRQVEAFYEGKLSSQQMANFLAENRIGYCLYGPFERRISPTFEAPPGMVLVYKSGTVEIYMKTD